MRARHEAIPHVSFVTARAVEPDRDLLAILLADRELTEAEKAYVLECEAQAMESSK